MKNFALMFDMDGVIVDSNPYHKKSLLMFAEKYGLEVTDEDMRQHMFGKRNEEWIPHFFGKLSAEKIREYSLEKEALYREVHAAEIVALEGLKSFLETAQNAGIACAVATSAPPENVDFALGKTGLRAFFQAILDSRFVEKGKPDPQIYLRTAETLGYKPENCIVFEDSIAGVQSGLAAGCKVVGLTTTHTPDELEGIHLAIPNFSSLTLEHLAALFN